MNLFDLLYAKGFPQLSFKLLLKLRGGDSFIIAAPGQPSFIIKKDGSSFKKCFRSDQFNFLSPFDFNDIETKCFLTVASLNNSVSLLSATNFVEETISTYQAIIDETEPYEDVFQVLNSFTVVSVLEGLGYLAQLSIEGKLNSIREFLASKSNDYSLLDFIWKQIFSASISDSDAAEIFTQNNSINNQTSVSIIIPCFDSNSTILNTVESILSAFSHLPPTSFSEIIVVDDSGTLQPKFSNEKVKIISSNFKLHCGGARNVGMSVAKGDIIFLIDSDTYIAKNYIINHLLRHHFFPNLITVSMREQIQQINIPLRCPIIKADTRFSKTYDPEWKTLNTISEPITVMPLNDTQNFKNFGYGKKLGPTDLPFMVKGNNVSFSRKSVGNLTFCNRYEGWGPEDVSFAANLISKGFFVVPVLSTGVFHVEHAPRSGSEEQKEKELEFNLGVHNSILNSHPYDTW